MYSELLFLVKSDLFNAMFDIDPLVHKALYLSEQSKKLAFVMFDLISFLVFFL